MSNKDAVMLVMDSQINSVLASLSKLLKKQSDRITLVGRDTTAILCGMYELNKLLKRTSSYCGILNAIMVQDFQYPWIWQKVHEFQYCRVGLMKIFSSMSVPLHDHPGASGALLILDGCLRVSKYQHGSSVVKGFSSFKKLSHVSDDVLHRHDMTIYTHTLDNIHGLTSLSNSCVLLCFQSPVFEELVRSWYFSMGAGGSGMMYLSTPGLRGGQVKYS